MWCVFRQDNQHLVDSRVRLLYSIFVQITLIYSSSFSVLFSGYFTTLKKTLQFVDYCTVHCSIGALGCKQDPTNANKGVCYGHKEKQEHYQILTKKKNIIKSYKHNCNSIVTFIIVCLYMLARSIYYVAYIGLPHRSQRLRDQLWIW